MPARQLYLCLLILGTAFWGVSFTFTKVGVADGSPFVFLGYKFALAALVLCVIFFRRLRRLDTRTFLAGLAIGLPLCLGNIFQTVGLQHTSITNTAFITGLDVLLIPLFKWALFRKRVEPRIWICCAVALTGLYLIVARAGLSLNPGDIWIMCCAVFFASYVLTVGFFSHKFDPMLTVIVALATCAAGCVFAALFDPRADWAPAQAEFWEGVLFCALLATAFMYAVQSAAQKHLEEEKVALTYLFEPIFAAFAGALLLGETLDGRTLLGAALIFSALLIAEIDLRALMARRPRDSRTP
ncbi:MAG TPA: DMT family transporter [Pseudomonas sp.]|nr:DMT family transporter [Pseudomonas sp.]